LKLLALTHPKSLPVEEGEGRSSSGSSLRFGRNDNSSKKRTAIFI
jgi:hypothetical protein